MINISQSESLDKQFRILVIDDDESIRTTTAAILQSEGYVVDTAENGKAAIEKSNADVYHVAVIDFRLPDMEGTELLTALREITPRMAKIMVTGYPTLQNAIECVNKQADAYFIKPVDYENLLSTIKKLIQKQQERERFHELIEAKNKEIRENEQKLERLQKELRVVRENSYDRRR
jgi:DNA-binding NtrC family response regulator